MSIDEVYSTMPNFIFVPMIAISVLAITGQYSQLKSSWVGFTSMTDKTGTQLYYPSHQQEVWSKLNRHAFPEPLLVISSSGYPEYLGANHTSLKTWCYISTVATRQETDNIIKSMSESHYWAVYQASGSINLVNDNRFTSIVNQMEVIHQDEKFIYYRRR